jgi:recombinational DNA repair protein (RecF pathway)
MQLLTAIGYEPRLDACVRCERFLDESEPPVGFSAGRGGALCGGCKNFVREETHPLCLATLRTLQHLTVADDARALAALELPELVQTEMNRILRAHLKFRLERDLRTTAALDALRAGV